MKSIPVLALALSTLLLAACGGGGGGEAASAPAPTVTITSSNQGTVARATIDGGQALGAAQPLDTSDRATAQSLRGMPAASRIGALQTTVRRAMEAAFLPRRSASIASATRPMATTTSTVACAVSGSIVTSVTDPDPASGLSGGDTMSVAFNQCKETASDLLNGAMVFTIGSVSVATETNVQFSGTLAFQQVSAIEGTSATTINGSVTVAVAMTSTSVQMTLAVGGDGLTVTSTAPGYGDTIVYDPGMQIAVSGDGDLTSSVVSLNGSFSASSIGGRVTVTTLQPVTQLASDAHPSSGQIRVTGASGSQLRITALSATQVRLELDANGDGTYESSIVALWSTLASS